MQREDNEPVLDAMRSLPGAKVSGGRLHDFRKGWALATWPGLYTKRAHYFTRSTIDISFVESACGLAYPVRILFGEGNYPRCKRCASAREG